METTEGWFSAASFGSLGKTWNVPMTTRPWPFGTVVRHAGLGTLAMVLTDDAVLVQVLTLPYAVVVQTGRSIWEPEEK